MDEQRATEVVEPLRARRIFASVSRRTGVYSCGVRVVIPDGREALWDNDGAAGLEAMVLRNGVLVGFVPTIPDTDDLDASAVAELIAAADYDAPVATRSGRAVESGEVTPPSPAPPPVGTTAQRRWLRRR